MSNMKKTEEFLKAIEAAGLSEAFGKMCTIASQTIGVHLDDLIDDAVYDMENPAPETKPVWRVYYQDGYLLKQGKFWALPNENATKALDFDFKSLGAAKASLEKMMRRGVKGAWTNTTYCGSFSIDFVVDEETAKDTEVVHWKIEKQYRSKWEIVESK